MRKIISLVIAVLMLTGALAGGGSDEWVEDALKEAVNKDMIVISLLGSLGNAVKEEEAVDGMEEEAEAYASDAVGSLGMCGSIRHHSRRVHAFLQQDILRDL